MKKEKNKMFKAISNKTIYSYEHVKKVYDITQSYDITLTICAIAPASGLTLEHMALLAKDPYRG